jgi:hypothetical protein
MKSKKYHTVRTVTKSKINLAQGGKIDTPAIHNYVTVHSWLGTGTKKKTSHDLANHYGKSQLTMDIFRCQNYVFFFVPVPSQECTVT